MLDNNNSSIVNEPGNASTVEIAVTTLDTEMSDKGGIDFMKIDVEGFEMHVLQGATQLIKNISLLFC